MKYILYFLIIVLTLSCKKDSNPYTTEFETSNRAWINYKANINNSYSYISYSGSVFGSHVETKIIVQNGKVIGRLYIAGNFPPNSSTLQVTKTWTEDSSTLNTHTEGAAAVTIDDIYSLAKKNYLTVDTTKNDIYFSADSNGLIASCGYVPKGCMDDCFIGVNVKSITAL